MGLEGAAIGMAEGGRQFLLRVLEVVTKSLGSEVEAAIDQMGSVTYSHVWISQVVPEAKVPGRLTGPARPDPQWQCACHSSIRSGQVPAESETQQEQPPGGP